MWQHATRVVLMVDKFQYRATMGSGKLEQTGHPRLRNYRFRRRLGRCEREGKALWL